MTVPSDRDWDAEFDEITSHLTPRPDASRPASRQTFGPALDAGVPGFRESWRLPDESMPTKAMDPSESTSRPPEPDAPAIGAIPPPAPIDSDEMTADEDFVPPTPPPLETDNPATVIMLAALVLGPLWACYLLFFDRTAPTLWWSCAVAITLTGFVMAVVKQPKSRDEDSEDDGARV